MSHPVTLSNPSSGIQITQLCRLRTFFLLLLLLLRWFRRWKACPRQSQLRLRFDAFKSVTSSLRTDKIEAVTARPLLGFRWPGGKTNCTLHYLAFHSLFSQQPPPRVTRMRDAGCPKKKVLNRSGSGVFASFSTFTGTGEAVQLSKLSATAAAAAAGGKKVTFQKHLLRLEQNPASSQSPSVLFVREMLLQ